MTSKLALVTKNIKTLDDPHKIWPLVRSDTIALSPEKAMANPDRLGKFRELEVRTDLSASLVAAAKRIFEKS
ncbi:hypothetical protein BTUL_0337g00020 [Botrytis tulipae]|uniref:Uncharacterized protein n=1 Tax=Botrytis tulipae TaxID=87230 RepID=A0A4Z1E4W3_9HELO|nr:hypothetical protein BTUL_0337g00020 [Botrytis tulipae]